MEHGRSPSDLDELLRCNRELTAVVEEQRATIAAQQEALQRAVEQLTLLKKALFGPRRERYVPSPDQGLLFGEQLLEPPPAPPEELLYPVVPRKPKRPRSKFVFPQGLPVERIEHPLPEAERPCGCCGCERVVIDELVTKQLELEGPKARIVEHVRYTYACSKCRNGRQVVTTTKPTAPIEKSPFGASVLAWITAAKFERHMPLYREQEMLLEPLGMWLSRPLLCNLLKGTARALKPLADQLLAEILKSSVVQVDETPVRFLPGEAGKSRLGYLSGYAGDEEHRFLWYDFRPSRSRDGPQAVLAGYRGVLLTDGYSVYESLVNNSAGRLIAAACWMHARRGFDECVIQRATHSSRRRWPAFGCCTTLKIGASRCHMLTVVRSAPPSRDRWWNASSHAWRRFVPSCGRQPNWPKRSATSCIARRRCRDSSMTAGSHSIRACWRDRYVRQQLEEKTGYSSEVMPAGRRRPDCIRSCRVRGAINST